MPCSWLLANGRNESKMRYSAVQEARELAPPVMVQGYRQGSRAWVWGSSGLCPLPKQWLTPLRPDDEGCGPSVRTAMRATWCMGSYKWRWRNANRCVECVGSMPRCMHACTTDGMRLPSVVHTYRCGHTCMRPWTGSRCSSRTAQSAIEEWHVPGILLRRAAAAPASLARVRRSRRAFAHHQMQVSAGRETPVLLKGRQSGGGLLRRALGALQMTASPAQVPPSVVAVNDTWAYQRAGARLGHRRRDRRQGLQLRSCLYTDFCRR